MKVLFLQLSVPQQNVAVHTGNLPLAAHYLKAAVACHAHIQTEIVPEPNATWMGDAALVRYIVEKKPDVLAVTLYCWNLERSKHIVSEVKKQLPVIAIGGGPEVAPDHPLLLSSAFDYLVIGEGEKSLRDLLENAFLSRQHLPVWLAPLPADEVLAELDIPAIYEGIDPSCSKMLYLESQRGCPHACGFCFYNKARAELYRFSDETILKILFNLPTDEDIKIYILDPCLNSRPGLFRLLEQIKNFKLVWGKQYYGEIRAEAVTEDMAIAFRNAGFDEFEIGLQTTHKPAQQIMNRITDEEQFIQGCQNLIKHRIEPKVDLIIGLPGDDLASVKRSIDFVAQHELDGRVQIFPLALLPGTPFRERAAELGISYQDTPPYQVLSTPKLSREDILAAFAYAEEKLGIRFEPFPELDLSDAELCRMGMKAINKLHFRQVPTDRELEWQAQQVAATCQLHIYPANYGIDVIKNILDRITAPNPFGVFEVVLWHQTVAVNELYQAMKLQHPHYLDNDRQYILPASGNRSVTFTAVLAETKRVFFGQMQRQIMYWEGAHLPTQQELSQLSHLDGICLPGEYPDQDIMQWYYDVYQEIAICLPITFCRGDIQVPFWEMTGREVNTDLLSRGRIV